MLELIKSCVVAAFSGLVLLWLSTYFMNTSRTRVVPNSYLRICKLWSITHFLQYEKSFTDGKEIVTLFPTMFGKEELKVTVSGESGIQKIETKYFVLKKNSLESKSWTITRKDSSSSVLRGDDGMILGNEDQIVMQTHKAAVELLIDARMRYWEFVEKNTAALTQSQQAS
jgi:hypothetical protein